MANLEQMVSVKDIVKRTGWSPRSVWREVAKYKETQGREGIGPAHKLSHRVTRFYERSVVKWIESRDVSMVD